MEGRPKLFLEDGTPFKGKHHVMPDGKIYAGKTHGSRSIRLYLFSDLPLKKSKQNGSEEKVDR